MTTDTLSAAGIGLSDDAFEHAPRELVQAFLVAVLRWQKATSDIERYLALKDLLETRARLDNYEPVSIRLSDGKLMTMDVGVPNTRGECPTQKPCPHVRCRYHLWRVDGGENGTRAGRPGLSSLPRGKGGLTLRVLGDLSGERPGTTLDARWLESPVPPSCALDEATKARTNEEVGQRIGKHRTLAARVVSPALETAKERAREMFGMSEEDLLEGLRRARENS